MLANRLREFAVYHAASMADPRTASMRTAEKVRAAN
jgi:hypothetical protein